MNNLKLYFITGLNHNNSYIYKYVLANNKTYAKHFFLDKYPNYQIDEIKIISPSKKLIDQYSNILKEIENTK